LFLAGHRLWLVLGAADDIQGFIGIFKGRLVAGHQMRKRDIADCGLGTILRPSIYDEQLVIGRLSSLASKRREIIDEFDHAVGLVKKQLFIRRVAQDKITQDFRRHDLQHIANGQGIAGAFAHFFSLAGAVNEVIRHWQRRLYPKIFFIRPTPVS
jgi:hypothetical protein